MLGAEITNTVFVEAKKFTRSHCIEKKKKRNGPKTKIA